MRVLLADDQPAVLSALRMLLEQLVGLEVVGEAVDGKTLLRQMRTTHPDLVLLDWTLPGLKAVGSVAALRGIQSDLHVFAISGRPEMSQSALDAGADAFFSKIDPPERLLAAICGLEEVEKVIRT